MSLTGEQLAAIGRRYERYEARQKGAQDGSTTLAAMISVADVPTLLDAVEEQKTTIDWATDTIKRLKEEIRQLTHPTSGGAVEYSVEVMILDETERGSA